MSRSSASRGQVEPLPALAAVVAVTLALAAYAGVTTTLPDPAPESTPAVPALKRVEAAATTGALLHPTRLSAAAADLDDYRVNVTLVADGRTWTAGPRPPAAAAAAASAPVAVTDGSRVAPGRLHVEVWPWPAR